MNRRGGLWRRFLRHRSAAAGLVVIAALAVVAALAPWLA
ncbi:MAG: ABC transporter permease, partial [Armatimonadota bacterium]|nr:ABC transporter permease [Armatimonadota bacterium]